MMGGALQGWSGIAIAYTAVHAPMIAGMIRARANLRQFLLSPIAALPLTAAAAAAARNWSPGVRGDSSKTPAVLTAIASSQPSSREGIRLAEPADATGST